MLGATLRMTTNAGEWCVFAKMPHVYCVAIDCKSDSRLNQPGVRFFQLPKGPQILKKWLQLLRRDGLEERLKKDAKRNVDLRHLVVCSKHFVDGEPTPENPHPTLFSFNNYKSSASKRKTSNSVEGRQFSSGNELSASLASSPVPIKKARLTKCKDVDKSSVCYPWVAGELELPHEAEVSHGTDSGPSSEGGIYFFF